MAFHYTMKLFSSICLMELPHLKMLTTLQPLPEMCPDSNQETSTPRDGRVPPTCLTQTGPNPTAAAPTVPLLTGLPTGLPSQAGIRGHNSYLSGVIEWTFSESQSDIQGRTGSNAGVFIALYMGK